MAVEEVKFLGPEAAEQLINNTKSMVGTKLGYYIINGSYDPETETVTLDNTFAWQSMLNAIRNNDYVVVRLSDGEYYWDYQLSIDCGSSDGYVTFMNTDEGFYHTSLTIYIDGTTSIYRQESTVVGITSIAIEEV